MKSVKLLFALLCLPALLWAQLPYQQSFETTSGYTTSVPFNSSGSDYFQRFNTGTPGNWQNNATVSGYNNTWYIGVEDHDFYTSNPSGPTEITVTTDAINIAGASNLEVSIKLSATGAVSTTNRYEGSDYLIVEYALNSSNTWVQIGNFAGGGGVGGAASPFYHDVLRNGVTGSGDDVQMGPAMADITYDIDAIVGGSVTGSTMKVRVRFSLAGPQEEVQFDDIRVTGIAPPPPPSCNIVSITTGTQSPCINNVYSQNVEVTYSAPPASGSLDVNGQSFTIGTSPQMVTLMNLVADGNPVNVTAVFSADAGCTKTETGLFTAPAACPPPPPSCSISAISAGTQTSCVNNLYTQEVIVTYSNAPASGTLDVNGQSFAITGSPQTVTLSGLSADGLVVDVTAAFSDDAGCTKTETGVFTAPGPCGTTPSCPITTAYSYTPLNAGITNYGVFNPEVYYWGLSRAMPVEVTPSGGTGPYTYQWSNTAGHDLRNANGKKVRLWYPTGSFWLKVAITDVGAGCTKEDSVYINWTDEYTCNPPGQIWWYQMCRTDQNGQNSTCIHTWWNMVDSLATGNYQFGACGGQQPQPQMGQGDDLGKVNMSLFPNPTTPDMVTYIVEGESIARYKVEVVDLNGSVYVEEIRTTPDKIASGQLDLKHLKSGVYFVRITTNNETIVNRLIITE